MEQCCHAADGDQLIVAHSELLRSSLPPCYAYKTNQRPKYFMTFPRRLLFEICISEFVENVMRIL